MSLRISLALAAATLVLVGCASGGSRPRAAEPVRALMSADALMFVSFDSDGDVLVTTAEIDAGLQREFTRGDTNGDGNLQPIEFQNWANAVLGGGQLGPYRLDFDRNVDNVITREEFDTEIRARVGDYDSDENGVLSRTEFIRLIGQARPPRQQIEPRPRAP